MKDTKFITYKNKKYTLNLPHAYATGLLKPVVPPFKFEVGKHYRSDVGLLLIPILDMSGNAYQLLGNSHNPHRMYSDAPRSFAKMNDFLISVGAKAV
jgi:hypothetical protein